MHKCKLKVSWYLSTLQTYSITQINITRWRETFTLQKYSNLLTQHRRTRNLNVPLPHYNILLPPSFLRHLINWVSYYISILPNTVVHYICNVHPFPQLWLSVVTFRNRFVYTSLYSKCKLTHWDSVFFYVVILHADYFPMQLFNLPLINLIWKTTIGELKFICRGNKVLKNLNLVTIS